MCSSVESLAVEEAGASCCKRAIFSFSPIKEAMQMSLLRKATAELIGTFVVVLVSCAGSMTAVKEGRFVLCGHGDIAVGSGMAVMLMVWALAPISSAHLNPAVTLGFALARHLPWREVGAYIVAQIVGALLASLCLQVIVHDPMVFSTAINQPLHHSSASIVMESVATFILMLINMKVACDRCEVGELGGSFMIGSTVALLGYYGRLLCGGLSMNPARSLGPALVSMNLKYLHLFIFGPIVGAALSSLSYMGINQIKSETI